MTRERMRIVVTVGCCLGWAGVAAGQGLYWESTMTGIGKNGRASQNYAMPKMMKIVGSDGQVVILRGDQAKVITVDTKKQTYRETTFSEMEAAGKSMQAQMDTARGEMEKRMKDMPPEQRAMMEKMMPKMAGAAAAKPAALVVKKTGETKTIADYKCTKYVATEGDKTALVTWTTRDVKAFAGLRDDLLAFQKRMASAQRPGGGGIPEAYAKIEGFPMETEMGGIKTVVTKVEPRTTAASEFEVPAGYQKENPSLPKPALP